MSGSPDKPKYRIKTVGQKTGIPPITLRAWERRYQILSPTRETNRYRLYSDQDVRILLWLKKRLEEGMSISEAAAELKDISPQEMKFENPEVEKKERPKKSDSVSIRDLRDKIYSALVNHDEGRAMAVLSLAKNSLSLTQLIENIIIPMLVRIGEDWYTGKILIATEHFASSFIRGALMSIYQKLPSTRHGQTILIGSAPGDMHELGPLMMAIMLREAGYKVEFLGPDSPLEDLAEYTREEKARLVILSAATRESAMKLSGFKTLLEKHQPAPLFAYGGGAFSFEPALIEQIPGVYLGKTLSQSVDKVKELVQPRK